MDRLTEMAEELLLDFTLEEILEMNDLTDLEILEMLLENGLILEPENRLERP